MRGLQNLSNHCVDTAETIWCVKNIKIYILMLSGAHILIITNTNAVHDSSCTCLYFFLIFYSASTGMHMHALLVFV